jgi:hypothetical protein
MKNQTASAKAWWIHDLSKKECQDLCDYYFIGMNRKYHELSNSEILLIWKKETQK